MGTLNNAIIGTCLSLIASLTLGGNAFALGSYPDLPCSDLTGYACTNYGYSGNPGMYSSYAMPSGWNHNCTSYIGYVLTAFYPYHDQWNHFRDAKYWNIDAGTSAVKATGVTVSTTPTQYSVAQWVNVGHVAWVEKLVYTGTTVTAIEVTEDNWGKASSHRIITRDSGWPDNFIYFGPSSVGGGGGKPPVATIVTPLSPTN